MTYVVDASVALKWVIPEVLSDRAARLLDDGDALVAPEMLLVEVANALWRKLTRREITGREADRALELLSESGLDLTPATPLVGRALDLARMLQHPVYDCVYLALAERERATLVSADTRLVALASHRRLRVTAVDLAKL